MNQLHTSLGVSITKHRVTTITPTRGYIPLSFSFKVRTGDPPKSFIHISSTMAAARQSRLESLPLGKLRENIDLQGNYAHRNTDGYGSTEIKLIILESLPYFETLESLEEASPSTKKISRAFYSRVVTAVTLNELANRDVDIFSLADCSLIEIIPLNSYGSKPFLSTELEPALKSLKGQLNDPQKKPLLLDTNSCFALREIRSLVRWKVRFAGNRVVSATYMEVPKADDSYWMNKPRTYRAVYLGDDLSKMESLRWTMYREFNKNLAEMGVLKTDISAYMWV